MMRTVALLCVCLMVFAMTGCSGSLKGEPEMKEMIAAMKEANEEKDTSKKMAAFGKVMAAQKKLEDLKLTEEEKKKLEEKYKSEVEKYQNIKIK